MSKKKGCKPGYKKINGECKKIRAGLLVSIYKNPLLEGCSLGGVSEKHNTALLLMNDPSAQVFEESDDVPTLKVVRRIIGGKEYVHAEPVEPGSWAAGGSFIEAGDSRFNRFVNRYPISLHDRDMRLEK